jgi:hypothetical protein
MMRCTCLILSLDSGGDVSRGEDAGLHFCIAWAVESMSSVGYISGDPGCIFAAALGCSPARRYRGCV